jgi:hypothetical protein
MILHIFYDTALWKFLYLWTICFWLILLKIIFSYIYIHCFSQLVFSDCTTLWNIDGLCRYLILEMKILIIHVCVFNTVMPDNCRHNSKDNNVYIRVCWKSGMNKTLKETIVKKIFFATECIIHIIIEPKVSDRNFAFTPWYEFVLTGFNYWTIVLDTYIFNHSSNVIFHQFYMQILISDNLQ